MLNLNSIFQFILSDMKSGGNRFVKVDDEHIIDSTTGVEYHLYDDSFKMTHGGKLVAKDDFFTKDEQCSIWEIKTFITDPSLVEKRRNEYPVMIKEGREKLSLLYENPQPLTVSEPILEDNTTQYTG
ncbi:hypothetical protein NVP1055O_14 [Vibrio phage 1.055.O._10N.286.55.E9]|nr:hypothetical protein NVP1055O_14 [Vibrio phage 1.055.O._10N.286.55.E9]